MTVPEGGLKGGGFFGYGPGMYLGDNWTLIEGPFALSVEGEQVFLYCMSSTGDARPLNALSYNGPFQPPGLPVYGFNESALPTNLEPIGAVILPRMSNYIFKSPNHAVSNAQFQTMIQDPTQWTGSNTNRYTLGTTQGSYKTSAGNLIQPTLPLILVGWLGLLRMWWMTN